MIIASRIQLSLTLCEWDATSMTEQRIYGFTPRGFAPILLPLFLAGCAGDEKPSQAAAYTPAPASYFSVKLRPGDSLSEVAMQKLIVRSPVPLLADQPRAELTLVQASLTRLFQAVSQIRQ